MRVPVAPALTSLILLVLTFGARADELVPPYDVYEAGPLAADAIGPSLHPWQVVLQEAQGGGTWMLLALPDGSAGAELPGGARPRYLGRIRAGERVVLVAPEVAGRERLRAGRSLTIAPSNGTVLVTTEAPDRMAERLTHSFRVLERGRPTARPAVPGPPPGFRAALERARDVRPDGAARTPAEVVNVIGGVNPDSLRAYILQLSEPAGFAATRYYAHPNIEVIHKDYIQRKLRDALGDAMVSNHSFEMNDPDGNPIIVHNVVGKLPSAVPNPGAFLVTAHYDAIGNRSDAGEICAEGLRDPGSGCDCDASPATIDANPACAWDWRTDPAPGADDNASGVATVIEAARTLSALSFDFDIYFVAFQAEEQGLIGSAAFADSVAQAGQDIYGVLNLDMLAYNAVRNEADVITNPTSEWLADFFVETSELFVPDLPVEKHVVVFGRSDHASFWSTGVDAVLLFEDIELAYPAYHTFQDRWNTIFAGPRPNAELQLQLCAQLAIGTLARFAVHLDTPDLALPAGEVEARPLSGVAFETGQAVALSARVHNYGTSSLSYQGSVTDSLTARVTFYDGDPAAGAPLIAQSERTTFFPAGGVVPLTATWTTSPGQEGFHEIHAVVEGLDPGYDQQEPNDANNQSSASIFLQAPFGAAPALLAHYPYPNPIRGLQEDMELYFELTRDARRVTIDVFDLEGRLVGSFQASSGFVADGNQAGANRITGNDFRWKSPELESGVYLYSIRCFDGSDTVSDVGEGKFAVVR